MVCYDWPRSAKVYRVWYDWRWLPEMFAFSLLGSDWPNKRPSHWLTVSDVVFTFWLAGSGGEYLRSRPVSNWLTTVAGRWQSYHLQEQTVRVSLSACWPSTHTATQTGLATDRQTAASLYTPQMTGRGGEGWTWGLDGSYLIAGWGE